VMIMSDENSKAALKMIDFESRWSIVSTVNGKDVCTFRCPSRVRAVFWIWMAGSIAQELSEYWFTASCFVFQTIDAITDIANRGRYERRVGFGLRQKECRNMRRLSAFGCSISQQYGRCNFTTKRWDRFSAAFKYDANTPLS
jgi:hypothetical protein